MNGRKRDSAPVNWEAQSSFGLPVKQHVNTDIASRHVNYVLGRDVLLWWSKKVGHLHPIDSQLPPNRQVEHLPIWAFAFHFTIRAKIRGPGGSRYSNSSFTYYEFAANKSEIKKHAFSQRLERCNAEVILRTWSREPQRLSRLKVSKAWRWLQYQHRHWFRCQGSYVSPKVSEIRFYLYWKLMNSLANSVMRNE